MQHPNTKVLPQWRRKANYVVLIFVAAALGFGAGSDLERRSMEPQVNWWMKEAFRWKNLYEGSQLVRPPVNAAQ